MRTKNFFLVKWTGQLKHHLTFFFVSLSLSLFVLFSVHYCTQQSDRIAPSRNIHDTHTGKLNYLFWQTVIFPNDCPPTTTSDAGAILVTTSTFTSSSFTFIWFFFCIYFRFFSSPFFLLCFHLFWNGFCGEPSSIFKNKNPLGAITFSFLSLFPLQSMVFIDNFTFTSNQRRNAMDAPPYTLVLSRMFPFLKCSTVCPTFEALDTGQLVPLVFRQSSFFSSSACICVFQTKTSALLSMCTQTSDL